MTARTAGSIGVSRCSRDRSRSCGGLSAQNTRTLSAAMVSAAARPWCCGGSFDQLRFGEPRASMQVPQSRTCGPGRPRSASASVRGCSKPSGVFCPALAERRHRPSGISMMLASRDLSSPAHWRAVVRCSSARSHRAGRSGSAKSSSPSRRVGRRSSVAENTTPLLELFLIDFAACVPLLENIERRASAACGWGG